MSQPATPGKQRFLKLGILLITPFSILAAFGAFTANAWLSFSSEQYRSAANSPSGHFRAVLAEEHATRCEEKERGWTHSFFLKVERRAWFVKTGEFVPFCVAGDSAAGLSMRWSGPNELTIECPNCADERFEFYSGNWGEATFRMKIPVLQ
jgi:hypothetical protein